MDVRFVAATNHDLHERAEQGGFRSDLYFRLAQYSIRLPALRERPEDIPALTARFVQEAATELRRPIETIMPAALDLLMAHKWPGNVRELRNVLRRAVLQTEGMALRPETIRALLRDDGGGARTVAAALPADASLREVAAHAAAAAERQAICEALRAARGNKSVAARALKTDYKTLHVKMKSLGIAAREFGR
jgi:two-component system nitrogen regulation response regulator GlnG